MFSDIRKGRTGLLALQGAIFVALLLVVPSLHAQNGPIALPGTTAYGALPVALAPASVHAMPASYSAQSFSAIQIPAERPNASVEHLPSRRRWLLLAAISSGAASFDAYSTRRSLASGNVELNPMMKSFAGSPAIYGAIQVSPLLMDFASFKMQRNHNTFVRRLWWIPQATGTAMSVMAGAHNLSIAK